MVGSPFHTYKAQLEKELRAGNATEHTHRPALKALIEALEKSTTATNEPKREACGAPDYVVSRSTAHGALTIGHIETKAVGVSLDESERTEQLERYLSALDNLVLTDYLEFRWYVDGQRRVTQRPYAHGRRTTPSALSATGTPAAQLAPRKDL